MKYRMDFVTNSSSSSFIVTFKNKQDMKEQFNNMTKEYPYYSNEVFKNIEENRYTYLEVLKYLSERLEWESKYHICYNMPEYRDKDFSWRKSEEFKELQKEYIRTELERFKNTVNHRGIFAVVHYSDHTDIGSELEHNILPYMPFVYKVLSNH